MIIAVAGAFGLARGRDKAEPRFGAGREAGQRLRVGTQRDDKIPAPLLARRDRLGLRYLRLLRDQRGGGGARRDSPARSTPRRKPRFAAAPVETSFSVQLFL